MTHVNDIVFKTSSFFQIGKLFKFIKHCNISNHVSQNNEDYLFNMN